jgi:hypothetical protein
MRSSGGLCLIAALSVFPACAESMKAGFAKTDITPHEPVEMGGYDLRNAPSEGVHDNEKLFVRCTVFDDGSRRLAFVVSDVIGIQDHDEFRKRISATTRIPVDQVGARVQRRPADDSAQRDREPAAGAHRGRRGAFPDRDEPPAIPGRGIGLNPDV